MHTHTHTHTHEYLSKLRGWWLLSGHSTQDGNGIHKDIQRRAQRERERETAAAMTKANALRTIRDRSSRNEIIDARLRSHSSLILTQMDIYKLHLTLLASTPRAACSTAVTWFWSRAISLSLSIPSPTSAPFPFFSSRY